MKNYFKPFILLISLLALTEGFAKTFQTEYLSFEIPNNWKCSQAPPNWICEPSLASERKFAIITVTSKEAGSLDQLSNFEAHLSRPRSHQMGSKTPVMSQVMKTNRRTLKGQQWVQSLHLNSEVNNFFTLYLATVKNPLAIMVTMSAEKEKWAHFNKVFESVIGSLQLKKVNFKPGQSFAGSGLSPQAAQQGAGLTGEGLPLESQSTPGLPTIYIVGLVLAGLVFLAAIYLILK